MLTTLTTDETIEMARQAGMVVVNDKFSLLPFLEAFAKLVADKKHEELYRLAEEAPVRGDARQTRQNILHAIRVRGNT